MITQHLAENKVLLGQPTQEAGDEPMKQGDGRALI
jgi:hypothetical protein